MRRNSEVESAGSANPLLDDASRAYTEGQYDEALRAWQEVLASDPANARARQGIKKVQMLRARGNSGPAPPADPVEARVKKLTAARQFKKVAAVCREHLAKASPQEAAQLDEWRQRAERAEASEPSIRRCMESARREIQAGNIPEALTSLKQVLALDRQHPVAAKLVEGILKRARKRERPAAPVVPAARSRKPESFPETPPPPGGTAGPAASVPRVKEPPAGPLPASGQPGSDAVPFSLDSLPQPPAPPGRGLPSSPLPYQEDELTIPEIELEMIPMEEAGSEAGGGGGEDNLDANLVMDDASAAIRLEPVGPQAEVTRPARKGVSRESPFSRPSAREEPGPEVSPPGGTPSQEEPSAKGAVQTRAGTEAVSDGRSPQRDQEKADFHLPLAMEKSPSRRSSRQGLLLVFLVGLAAVFGAAWWFGALPWGGENVDPGKTSPARKATPLGVHPTAATVTPASASGGGATDSEAAAGQGQPAIPAPHSGQGSAERTNAPAAAQGAQEGRPRQHGAGPARDPAAALALFGKGQELFEASRFKEAAELFEKAVRLDPVNAEIASWQVKTAAKMEEEQRQNSAERTAIAAFGKKNFETALRGFYRLQEAQPNGPYEKYIRNSWYNWGLQLLAGGNLREAEVKMNEVLSLDAGDVQAQRVKELISDYRKRAKDNLFYLRIQELRYRPLDG